MDESLVPCPHCGGEIRTDATFCRHCGSSDADGWSDGEYADGYDDADDFDYEQYVEEHHSPEKISTGLPPIWRAVVIVLIVAFLATLLVPLL